MWPSHSASSSSSREEEEEEEEGVWELKLPCLLNWIDNRRKRSGEVSTKDEDFPLPPVVNFDPLSILLFLILCLFKEILNTKRRKVGRIGKTMTITSFIYGEALWWRKRRRKRSDQPWPSPLALNMTRLWGGERKRSSDSWRIPRSPELPSAISILSKLLSSVPSSSSSSSLQSFPSIGGWQEERGAVSRVWAHAPFLFAS